MHYTTKQLAEFRFLSVEILLFDALAVLKFRCEWNVAMFHVRNGLVCCQEMKYEKSYRIRTEMRINITHHKSRSTKRSHAHLRDGLPFHSHQVQIIPPASSEDEDDICNVAGR